MYLPHPVAVSVLCGLALAAWWPVERPFSKWQTKLAAHIARVANDYFPVTLEVHEDTRLLCDKKGAKVVMGLEPHSVLPISVIAFHAGMPHLPKELDKPNRAALASSAIFRVPLVKHLWSWLGLQSVDKKNMKRLLDEDNSVLLIPGGVQECLHMQRGKETIFLRKRTGFVKMAMQSGAHLVPAFAFGQSDIFGYWRPGTPAMQRAMSRLLGFAPMLFWGRWGTPIPRRVPVHVVVGKPIRVKRDPEPSKEAVAALLDEFIAAMQSLFEQHKTRAGYANCQLVVL